MSPADNVRSLVSLVATGVLDAELAGLAWLLLEQGVPVHVAGGRLGDSDRVLEALIAALPAERRPGGTPAPGSAGAHRLVRVGEWLSVSSPQGLLRAALAATTGRSGLASTMQAVDLPQALEIFRRQGLSDDEISFMGAVLVFGVEPGEGSTPTGAPSRVVAAHYLRPVARDAAGHVQRLGPAVLATWDPQRSRYDHFAWGIYPELAARTGRRAGDLEHEHAVRAGGLRREATPGEP